MGGKDHPLNCITGLFFGELGAVTFSADDCPPFKAEADRQKMNLSDWKKSPKATSPPFFLGPRLQVITVIPTVVHRLSKLAKSSAEEIQASKSLNNPSEIA